MKILIYDIETAPNLAWVWGRWKQNISMVQMEQETFMLSFAAKWLGSKQVIWKSHHHHGHKAMVKALWKLIDEADVVVAHNGDYFDNRVTNGEFLKLGLKPPFKPRSVDTYKVAKKHFKLNSYKLDDLGKLLNVGRKLDHEGFELWIKCLKGDRQAWDTMVKYNKQDVVLLEKVYLELLPWHDTHPNYGLFRGAGERPVCKNCGSAKVIKNGLKRNNVTSYQRYRCADCGTEQRGAVQQSDLDFRRGILR